MLEGTYRCRGAVFGVHAHVVPTTDPDVKQMAAFRDLLRDGRRVGTVEAKNVEIQRKMILCAIEALYPVDHRSG